VSRLRLSMIIWFMFITYAIIVAYLWLGQQMLRVPIAAVEVNSDMEHITKQEIIDVVQEYIAPGFFALNIVALQQSLTKLPWVAAADLKKVWPDKLVISLTEKQAVARWGDDGFITTQGEVFYPVTSGVHALPVLRGNKTEASKMLVNYLLINELLSSIGLKINELEIMPDCGWRAMLDNEVILFLGKDALPERTKRFVLAYRGLSQTKVAKIGYIDTRYTNGVSVGWKN